MIDSGASLSVIHIGWRRDIPTNRKDSPTLRTASGDRLHVLGTKMVPIRVGTETITIPMVECTVQRAIISTNTLAAHGYVTVFNRNGAHVEKSSARTVLHRDNQGHWFLHVRHKPRKNKDKPDGTPIQRVISRVGTSVVKTGESILFKMGSDEPPPKPQHSMSEVGAAVTRAISQAVRPVQSGLRTLARLAQPLERLLTHTPQECESFETSKLRIPDCTEGAVYAADQESVESESDGRPPRARPTPVRPSDQEVQRHHVTHIPYAAWRDHCVAGRSVGERHMRIDRS